MHGLLSHLLRQTRSLKYRFLAAYPLSRGINCPFGSPKALPDPGEIGERRCFSIPEAFSTSAVMDFPESFPSISSIDRSLARIICRFHFVNFHANFFSFLWNIQLRPFRLIFHVYTGCWILIDNSGLFVGYIYRVKSMFQARVWIVWKM